MRPEAFIQYSVYRILGVAYVHNYQGNLVNKDLG